jgi:hypothetical protein
MDGFVDREVELSRLRDCYDSDVAALAVIYGRRRLGKTQLVRHWLSERDDAVVYPEELFLDIGRWWYQEHEVDVVGFTDAGTMVVGECKFTNAPLDYSALASLEDHAAEIRWTPLGGGDPDIEYALFARSGATRSVREAVAERGDLQLFGLEDVTENA